MAAFKDLSGLSFNHLHVINQVRDRRKSNGGVFWLCMCACGQRVIVGSSHILTGHTQSCGCIKVKRLTRHGFVKQIPEYSAWLAMRGRCNRPTDPGYARYGGRGIAVCSEWNACFEIFYKDVGPRPSAKHSLDRIDNDKGYFKENCRWATRCVQNRNKGGVKLTQEKAEEIRFGHSLGMRIKDLAEMYDLSRRTVQDVVHNRTWVD